MATNVSKHSKSRKFAELLDSQFTIPGTKIKVGIDPIIGLVSGVGDLAGASLSIYFMAYAAKLGAKPAVLIRMFINILVDLTIGAIPVLGDIFDVAWKANLRNAILLEKLEQNPDQLENQSSILNWILFIFLISILIGVIVGLIWAFVAAWNKLFG
ncbi:MAG: DUF4112 domain-containing protein [Balneolaceae bacterium]|nr:DUF4112 domain-containing protein [Balneolaceae bacterium]